MTGLSYHKIIDTASQDTVRNLIVFYLEHNRNRTDNNPTRLQLSMMAFPVAFRILNRIADTVDIHCKEFRNRKSP